MAENDWKQGKSDGEQGKGMRPQAPNEPKDNYNDYANGHNKGKGQ